MSYKFKKMHIYTTTEKGANISFEDLKRKVPQTTKMWKLYKVSRDAPGHYELKVVDKIEPNQLYIYAYTPDKSKYDVHFEDLMADYDDIHGYARSKKTLVLIQEDKKIDEDYVGLKKLYSGEMTEKIKHDQHLTRIIKRVDELNIKHINTESDKITLGRGIRFGPISNYKIGLQRMKDEAKNFAQTHIYMKKQQTLAIKGKKQKETAKEKVLKKLSAGKEPTSEEIRKAFESDTEPDTESEDEGEKKVKGKARIIEAVEEAEDPGEAGPSGRALIAEELIGSEEGTGGTGDKSRFDFDDNSGQGNTYRRGQQIDGYHVYKQSRDSDVLSTFYKKKSKQLPPNSHFNFK